MGASFFQKLRHNRAFSPTLEFPGPPGWTFWAAALSTSKSQWKRRCGGARSACSRSRLPYKRSSKYESYSDGEFLYNLREIREALVLVAAVAHVDQEAW
ncbi:hypothetical protein JG687_00015218 [Phytophthora cactorum]|uniref:Uncharacterized protein n=1 Tax=Phytophthora cactorum TaxID=29920 RepID=A0A8T1TUB3_9STRA|nr:hypothetical protein JG687_00015218 [Phytophthora cactorum]